MKEDILVLLYMLFAGFVGWRWLTGRSSWLDQKKPVNILVKLLAALVVGVPFSTLIIISFLFKLVRS